VYDVFEQFEKCYCDIKVNHPLLLTDRPYEDVSIVDQSIQMSKDMRCLLANSDIILKHNKFYRNSFFGAKYHDYRCHHYQFLPQAS